MTSTTRLQLAWCGAAFALLALPNLAALVIPFEHWPLTSAPMFAASPIANARYRTHFIVEERMGGVVTDVPLDERATTGLSGWHFRRAFLVHGWGGDDDDAPFGYVDGDTADARAARVAGVLGGIVRVDRAKPKKKRRLQRAIAIRVEIEQVHPAPPAGDARRVLGRYDIAADRFDFGGGAR